MMSSTTRTCRPLMSPSRSLRIRTTPEDLVPEPYDDTAIQSIWAGECSARARSAMTMTAPLSTPTSSRSRPCVVGVDLGGELGDAGSGSPPRVQDPLEVVAHVVSVHARSPAEFVGAPAVPAHGDRPAVGGLCEATCSLPHDLLADPPPGRATGPWPCQSLTSASSAVTWPPPAAPARPAAAAFRRTCVRTAAGSSARTASSSPAPPSTPVSPATRSAQSSRASASSRSSPALRARARATPGPEASLQRRQHVVRAPAPGRSADRRCAGPPRPSGQGAGRPVRLVAAERRATVGAARPDRRPCRRASGRRNRGRDPAGPSRPGRRACARAGPPLRRAAAATPASAA